MNVALWLLWFAAVPSTTAALIYGLLNPWWRNRMGRALFASTSALAILVDINLLYRLFNWTVLSRTGADRNLAYAYIGIAAWLMCLGMVLTMIDGRRIKRRNLVP